MGKIAAGSPIEAIADETLFDSGHEIMGSRRFLIKSEGQLHDQRRHLDGDYVICEKLTTPATGQIVVALIDNQEATLKRFYRNENGSVSLFPANAAYSPMVYGGERREIMAFV